MSKLIAVGLGVAGLTVTAVGGYYLFGGGSSSQSQTETNGQTLLFDGVQDFKSRSNAQTECIAGYMDGLDLQSSEGLIEQTEVASSFFKADSASQSRSCVRLEYQKRLNEDKSKWFGKFTTLWTYVNGEQGMVSFASFVTDTSVGKKLLVSGVVYLTHKDEGAWKVKHKQEIVDQSKEVTSDSMSTYFPEAPLDNRISGMQSINAGKYWGFMIDGSKNEKFNSMCLGDQCKSNPLDHQLSLVLEWNSSSGGSHGASEWTTSTVWWTNMYWATNHLSGAWTSQKGTWTLKPNSVKVFPEIPSNQATILAPQTGELDQRSRGAAVSWGD